MCQAVSTGYVTVTTQTGRSSAVGLYATSFYVGGTAGGVLGSIAWTIGNYPACVALVIAVLAIIAVIVAAFWDAGGSAPVASQHGSPPA